ncbi:MAG: hypothetical protein IT469_01655 [Pseudomonadales bacterium]|nr:hypothetical protein [Pseudomonadales bacterium]
MPCSTTGAPTHSGRISRQELADWLQLITLIGGIILVSMQVGRRDQVLEQHTAALGGHSDDIKDLRQISADLLSSNIRTQEQLVALKERVEDIRHSPH